MKNLMRGLAGAASAALLCAYAAGATAQINTEKTHFTITEPLNVGGTILEPGTYRIKVVVLASNRNVVHVTNDAGTKIFAAVLATPHPIKTDEAIPESRFAYYPPIAGQPRALRTWFAHDTPYGQDILYRQSQAMELAAAAKVEVIAYPDEVKETEYETATLTVVTPERKLAPYQAPVLVAEARLPERLPKTASQVPLIATLGLLTLGGAAGLRVLANRS